MLLSLLPYSDNQLLKTYAEKKRLLDLILFILNSAKKSIQYFTEEQYQHFDAQVSENLCQIRAYQLCALSKSLAHSELINDIPQLDSQIERFQNLHKELSGTQRTRRNHAIFINDLIYEQNRITINQDTTYLLKLYILSKYSIVGDYNISYGINYDLLCQDTSISSKTFIRKFVHHLQRSVSKLSCQFVFSLLSDIKKHQYQRILLQELYQQDEVGRHLIACYEVTRTILQHAWHTGKIIKLLIHRKSESESKLFTAIAKPGPTDTLFNIDFNNNSDTTNALCIEGISQTTEANLTTPKDFISKLNETGIVNIILSNMAQHPQYSGLKLNDKKYNPYENLQSSQINEELNLLVQKSEEKFLFYKQLANKIGCAAKNNSLFLITHIYFDSKIPIKIEKKTSEADTIS